jgi:hypothetical protein
MLRFGRVDEGTMEFKAARARNADAAGPVAEPMRLQGRAAMIAEAARGIGLPARGVEGLLQPLGSQTPKRFFSTPTLCRRCASAKSRLRVVPRWPTGLLDHCRESREVFQKGNGA